MQREQKKTDHQGGLKKPDQDAANDSESKARAEDASTGLKKPDQEEADAKVDEAVDESFPASDPPAFNRGHSGAPTERSRNDIEKP